MARDRLGSGLGLARGLRGSSQTYCLWWGHSGARPHRSRVRRGVGGVQLYCCQRKPEDNHSALVEDDFDLYSDDFAAPWSPLASSLYDSSELEA